MEFPIKNGDFPVRYVKLPEGNIKDHPNHPIMDHHPNHGYLKIFKFIVNMFGTTNQRLRYVGVKRTSYPWRSSVPPWGRAVVNNST